MEKILERVRKLLAMANDERGNEGERDNALRMANNLMAKYQLDMADIPTEVRERDDPIGRFDVDGWYIPWCNMIRGSVARLFSCKYLQGGKINATRGRHIFIGRASNATTAMLMSDWIVKEALREADRVAGHRLTPAGRSFGLGVASRLARRVTELLEKSAAELSREQGSEIQSNGRDLVIDSCERTLGGRRVDARQHQGGQGPCHARRESRLRRDERGSLARRQDQPEQAGPVSARSEVAEVSVYHRGTRTHGGFVPFQA
jgi:hypothetical protein